jgi:hypothetical protein
MGRHAASSLAEKGPGPFDSAVARFDATPGGLCVPRTQTHRGSEGSGVLGRVRSGRRHASGPQAPCRTRDQPSASHPSRPVPRSLEAHTHQRLRGELNPTSTLVLTQTMRQAATRSSRKPPEGSRLPVALPLVRKPSRSGPEPDRCVNHSRPGEREGENPGHKSPYWAHRG